MVPHERKSSCESRPSGKKKTTSEEKIETLAFGRSSWCTCVSYRLLNELMLIRSLSLAHSVLINIKNSNKDIQHVLSLYLCNVSLDG